MCEINSGMINPFLRGGVPYILLIFIYLYILYYDLYTVISKIYICI